MVFNSVDFLLFFPIVIMVYFVIPAKKRYLWLLAASYYFYMCWNPKDILMLLFSTVVAYISGLLMDKIKEKNWDRRKIAMYKKVCVAVNVVLSLSFLCFYKYTNFILNNITLFLKKLNISFVAPDIDILLPIGISFFTFQTLGYIIDVYREETQAEKNFFRFALFVSFFPTILSGPIERSKNLLKQLQVPTYFNVENARKGLVTFAWGLFMKVVVADRISTIINPIFSDYTNYSGMVLMVATILFAFQIYCDFEGYTQMAVGSALIVGFSIKENFDSPYFSLSVKEFWRRWHISLTSCFRDYLYIPLGGNRKGKWRKHINTMIVFLTSGLWHGAGWKFVVWGGLNGFYIVCQDLTKQMRDSCYKRFGIKTNTFAFRCLSRVVTFTLIDIAWLFFKAESLTKGLTILKMMVRDLRLEYLFTDLFWNQFMTIQNLLILSVSLMIVIWVDYLKYKKIDVWEKILSQQVIFRWTIYIAIIVIILFWGVYGEGYGQTQFIYFQF